MDIVLTGRHIQIKQKFRDVVESKMNRVTAIAPDAQRVQVVLSHEGNPRLHDTAVRVELTVVAGPTVVRAEASSLDEVSALDLALDKLTLRLRRARDRRKDHRKNYTPVPVDAGKFVPPSEEREDIMGDEDVDNSPASAVAGDLGPGESVEVHVGDTPIVIRRKLHVAEPMSIDEALYEMELIGHDFFLFVNKDTGRPSVVYHRHGWSYGVFEIDTPRISRSSKRSARPEQFSSSMESGSRCGPLCFVGYARHQCICVRNAKECQNAQIFVD